MTNHTPTPWKANKNHILDSNGDSIAHVNFGDGEISAYQDAAFIVTAVNFHDRLCDALDDLLSTEECVCIEAELEKGNCSVCTYEKLLEEIKAVKS